MPEGLQAIPDKNRRMKPEEFYLKRKELYEDHHASVRKKTAKIAWLRLFSLAAAIYFLVKAFNTDFLMLYPLVLFLVILFFTLVSYHRNLNNFADRLKNLILINEKELKALQWDYSLFDEGSEFLSTDHEFSYDLDIFGKKSLYQYINRCCSYEGRKVLADRFTHSPCSQEVVIRNQQIIAELRSQPDFLQEFMSWGQLSDDTPGAKEEIYAWLNEKDFQPGRAMRLGIYLLPAINLLIILSGIFYSPAFRLLYLSLPVSWLFYGMHFKKINDYHSNISRKQSLLGKYIDLNRILSQKTFQHPFLAEMARKCAASFSAHTRLDKLVNYLDARLNLIVGLVLNTILLFDFHIILRLESWKKQNRELVFDFFDIPAEFDSFLSLSVFSFNNPEYCTPVIGESGLNAKSLSHPLIPLEKRISNDFSSGDEQKIFVITGANMAGKSTFLRTLGVNMILAGMGAPVCAEKMSFSPRKVITGMRTTDNLAESESYFYAELKRLHRIIEKLEQGEKLMILLDEILKGTNSNDKHKGSVALLNQLSGFDCLTFIATHDLSLGEEEKNHPGILKNICFESYIHNGELKFDYKLKKGIAQNMNAYFLMKKMGIVKEKPKD